MNWQKIIPSKKHIRYGFIILLAIVIIAPIIVYFRNIANFLFGESQKYNGELFKVLVTILGGLLVLWGLYLNYRRTKILEVQTNNQADQIKAFVKQNEITEKGKVDERFKNAIEHLGHDKDAIVLGGIYALHRIAQEDKSYRQTVFDILCSYFRDKTISLKEIDQNVENGITVTEPTIVIQTIIDLLFKIRNKQEYIYAELRANLNGINCLNGDFNTAQLIGANLVHSTLNGSDLSNANLIGANLIESNLIGVILISAHLEGSKLSFANLIGSDLKKSFLEGSDLQATHLEGSYLMEAHLEGSCLRHTYLNGAVLNNSHMEGVFTIQAPNIDFVKNIQNRIGKNSEFSKAIMGKLDEVSTQNLIDNTPLGINIRDSNFEFTYKISQAANRDTNIEKDAMIGILTQEKAEDIIERYNKAMANVPKR